MRWRSSAVSFPEAILLSSLELSECKQSKFLLVILLSHFGVQRVSCTPEVLNRLGSVDNIWRT